MARVYNFSAGPAVLPEDVLRQAAAELVDYRGCGMSVMEMSHRGKEYEAIIAAAEADLRELLAIPADYTVLFLQGGASLQFSMVPLNLARGKKADYINTGLWSKKAIAEAKKFLTVSVIASSEDKNFSSIPDLAPDQCNRDADYCYCVTNNTIYGTTFYTLPQLGDVPLVADMSSNILSEPLDVRKFGLIFAGAQKNIGPAGLTVVIIRNDLLGQAQASVPAMLNYTVHSKERSMYNTPPTYAIYMAGLVFRWIKSQGGLIEMQRRNRQKAAILYDYLDASRLFRSPVRKADRSLMNVPFVTGDEQRDEEFIRYAAGRGLKTLKGHRTVGGMRASIYNAMPLAGVEALVAAMRDFEAAVA